MRGLGRCRGKRKERVQGQKRVDRPGHGQMWFAGCAAWLGLGIPQRLIPLSASSRFTTHAHRPHARSVVPRTDAEFQYVNRPPSGLAGRLADRDTVGPPRRFARGEAGGTMAVLAETPAWRTSDALHLHAMQLRLRSRQGRPDERHPSRNGLRGPSRWLGLSDVLRREGPLRPAGLNDQGPARGARTPRVGPVVL